MSYGIKVRYIYLYFLNNGALLILCVCVCLCLVHFWYEILIPFTASRYSPKMFDTKNIHFILL